MADQKSKHSAAAAATGYLYQCRYALLAALQEGPSNPGLEVSIEKFDDVAFEEDGNPISLIQAKHHVRGTGNLNDASVDLWKTLRIWSDMIHADPQFPFRTRLMLLTTGTAPSGSAASLLRPRERQEDKAREILIATAESSVNESNRPAYKSFRELPEAEQSSLIRAVTVLDGSPTIWDVEGELLHLLYLVAPEGRGNLFLERLEGWWFKSVIRSMASGGAPIPFTAIQNKIDELRDSMSQKSLPVDFADALPPPELIDSCDARPFVHQLRLIEIGERRIEIAVRDYYRASEQRSRWLREELLIDGEIQNYERELEEAWEPRFLRMKDGLTASCSHQDKVTRGESLYAWAEVEADLPIRNVRERFVCFGSYHILANQWKVGWHPEFSDHVPSWEPDE